MNKSRRVVAEFYGLVHYGWCLYLEGATRRQEVIERYRTRNCEDTSEIEFLRVTSEIDTALPNFCTLMAFLRLVLLPVTGSVDLCFVLGLPQHRELIFHGNQREFD